MTGRISYKEAYDNRSVPIAIANKQDRLTPGANVAISEDNVISVYGTEIGGYEAGEGISIDQNVISCTVDTDGLVTTEELAAGLAGKQPVGDYATNTRVNQVEAEIPSTANFATKAELAEVEAEIPSTDNFATKAELTAGLAGKQDFSILIRRIHIGTAQTPDASLGEDGDLYIYRPTE